MKPVKYIRILTFAAIVMILLLQGIWMGNAYRLIENQVYTLTNETFTISVNKELMLRKNSIVDSTTNEFVGIVNDDFEKGIFVGPELVLQEYLMLKQYEVQINTIDSIFHSEISRQNLSGKFIINRLNPETGEILETTDPKGEGKLGGALASEIIPVRMDGSEGVQALLISPYHTIFRQMVYALILSLLLILFIGYALFFLLRSFTRERHWRQLQNDFSNSLTHNMASPLQTIYQVNALMKNDQFAADAEKRNKFINLSQQQIINLQSLTDRILTIARAEKSPLSPSIKKTEIAQIMQQLVEKFSVQTKKEVCFSTNFEPDSILFYLDKDMFYNTISNLIDNSIKYSGKTVNIKIECKLKENGLHIAIQDDGYGISTSDQKTIFNMFERGAAVKRKEASGFGLGLSYVKRVMEAHHGTVNLHSSKGEGTLFELFFPFSDKQYM